MALTRFTNNVFPSFPSFIDRFFEGNAFSPLSIGDNWDFAGSNSTLPAVNVKENDNEYQIDVAAPGVKKSDFKLSYENGRLTISSEKKDEKEEKEGTKVTRKEFSYQSFQRSFSVPEDEVNADKISAKYSDGILHVMLPKHERAKTKPAKEIKIS